MIFIIGEAKIKLQAKAVADREFLSEAAWLKRLVMREILASDNASGAENNVQRSESIPVQPTRFL